MRQRSYLERTPIRRIYDEVCAEIVGHELEEQLVAQFPSFSSVERSMYKSRRKGVPPLPQNLDDLVLPQIIVLQRKVSHFYCMMTVKVKIVC